MSRQLGSGDRSASVEVTSVVDGVMTGAREIIDCTGWRILPVLLLIIFAALTEGAGLLMLVPLLSLVGVESEYRISTEPSGAPTVIEFVDLPITLESMLVVFVAVIFLRQLLVVSAHRKIEVLRVEFVNTLRSSIFHAIGRVKWQWFHEAEVTRGGHIIFTDAWRAGNMLVNFFRGISTAVVIIAYVIVALVISPALSALTVAGMLVIATILGWRVGNVQRRGAAVTQANDEVYSVVENYLTSLRTARLSKSENQLHRRFHETLDRMGSELIGFMTTAITVSAAVQLAAAIGLSIYVLLAVNVFGIAGSALLVVTLVAARLVPHVSRLIDHMHHVLFELPALLSARKFIDECERNQEILADAVCLKEPTSSIALRGISLSAPRDRQLRLLKDVSLEVQPGELVAISGPSGSGKTTLADVLSGLILPDTGGIYIDGVKLDDQQCLQWRSQVGLVPQTVSLLRGTLIDNLTWTVSRDLEQTTLVDLLQCCRVSDLIDRLPDGLETRIDRFEGRISGGERQRIAIARELLRKPSLLILDEATSSMGVDVEQDILAAIHKRFPTMAIVLITHRSKSVEFANRAYCMRDGEIVEDSSG
jgi:ATP-binding cassette subfamily C protein